MWKFFVAFIFSAIISSVAMAQQNSAPTVPFSVPQDTQGEQSIFFGNKSGLRNNVASVTKNLSTCYGELTCGGAGTGMTGTTPEAVGIGWSALSLLTSGNFNTAIGVASMLSETTGSSNTAVGTDSLRNGVGSASTTAIGAAAMLNVTTAANSTAVGSSALQLGTSTSDVAVGINALKGQSSSVSQFNTAVGAGAMSSASRTTAQNNVAIGVNALSAATATNSSTAVGVNAMQNTTGNSNIGLGAGAGSHLTTGTGNIIIGVNAANTTLTTGSNNYIFGPFDTAASGTTNTMNLGGIITTTGINVPSTSVTGIAGQVTVAAMTQSAAAQSGTVCYNTSGGTITYDATLGCLASSMLFKQDIQGIKSVDALKTAMQLEPVSFRKRESAGGDVDHDVQVGFLAEQVASVDERLTARGPDGNVRGVRYQQLTAILAGAIQELKAENDNLRACNDNWKCRLFGIRLSTSTSSITDHRSRSTRPMVKKWIKTAVPNVQLQSMTIP